MLALYEKELEQKSSELKRLYIVTNLVPAQYDPDLDITNQLVRRSLDSATYTFSQEGTFYENYLTGAKSETHRVIQKIVIFGESKGALSQVEF